MSPSASSVGLALEKRPIPTTFVLPNFRVVDIDKNLSEPDLKEIRELQRRPRLFEQIVMSLNPNMIGNELIKAGLILILFGGSNQSTRFEKDEVPIRSNCHVLLFGDPGLGKTHLLKSIKSVAPRCIYVNAKCASNAGLLSAVVKDGSGEPTLEAGALALAHKGCCCIDEMDKMGEQKDALLEVMEQQRISIAKCGIVCSMQAYVSIVAAANPVEGHYNSRKAFYENINMSRFLLSRFDLIFLMIDDKKNVGLDKQLCRHIALSSSLKRGAANATSRRDDSCFNSSQSSNNILNLDASTTSQHDLSISQSVRNDLSAYDIPTTENPSYRVPSLMSRRSTMSSHVGESQRYDYDDDFYSTITTQTKLIDRLKNAREELRVNPICHSLLKKYIRYTREKIHPILSDEANEALKVFYLNLRNLARESRERGNAVAPVTTRQLESLVRLTAAKARSEMRSIATLQDANDVLEIASDTLMIKSYEESIMMTQDSVSQEDNGKQKKVGKSTLRKRMLECIQNYALTNSPDDDGNIVGGVCISMNQIRQLMSENQLEMSNIEFQSNVSFLNESGFLISKGSGNYEIHV